ncbi:MAG: tripartite tricarboxylate transporter substrate binding protein [Candidatus Aenigmarchaeota archaeon]|nr:tripartite tricarboxylate transporter substrate binding protein [Candidatus Aenigmarchaeota archaeon]
MKTRILCLILGFFLIFFVGKAGATEFPTKAIQIINPFSAGGSTDMTCRVLASVGKEYFGEPIVVVTKSGGGGSIGAAYVARSKPDGYTLLVGSMATVVMRSLSEKLPYTYRDFVALGQLIAFKGIILVQGDSPWKTIDDLINDAKSKELTYGSAGVGTTGHLAIEALSLAVPGGLKFLHVPYSGSGPSQAALLGGHVKLIMGDPSVALPAVKAGKLRALAVVSSTRASSFPDVPTFKEKGYDVVLDVWRGVFAPKNTAPDVVAKLRESLKNAANSKVFVKMIKKLGQEYEFKPGEEFAKDVANSEVVLKKIMGKLGLLAK